MQSTKLIYDFCKSKMARNVEILFFFSTFMLSTDFIPTLKGYVPMYARIHIEI